MGIKGLPSLVPIFWLAGFYRLVDTDITRHCSLTHSLTHSFTHSNESINHSSISRLLVQRCLTFPGGLNRDVEHLIRRLLNPNPSLRLGMLRGGIEDIKKHRWFHGECGRLAGWVSAGG